MSKPFYFKQFTIHQANTAMKVGTDGVLLGAWADFQNTDSVLDIGTGTGLIALMMAQKYPLAKISAIEINEDAYNDATLNTQLSPWSHRISTILGDINSFNFNDKFDLIISNPPFYNSTFKELELKRALARHTHSLSFTELINSTAKHLSINGKCFFIIPFSEEENFVNSAQKYQLFAHKICRVKGNEASDFKRSLVSFSFSKIPIEESTLVIEKTRGVYTEAYINLVKDFYLKM